MYGWGIIWMFEALEPFIRELIYLDLNTSLSQNFF